MIRKPSRDEESFALAGAGWDCVTRIDRAKWAEWRRRAVSPEIDPTVDFAFKRLFGTPSNAALLVDLLNAVVAGPPVREVTFLNPFTEKEFENDKQAIFDIRAKDQAGRPFLLEMQKLVPWFFPKRILFNWAGAHAEQLQKGD